MNIKKKNQNQNQNTDTKPPTILCSTCGAERDWEPEDRTAYCWRCDDAIQVPDPSNSPPIRTPWGIADHAEQVAKGIWWVSTPSHGGYWLSEDRARIVLPSLRRWADSWAHGVNRYSGEWWEEDCCAAAVVLTWQRLFPENRVELARDILNSTFGQK